MATIDRESFERAAIENLDDARDALGELGVDLSFLDHEASGEVMAMYDRLTTIRAGLKKFATPASSESAQS